MLEELCRFENLGTPKFHFYLLTEISKSKSVVWTRDDIASLYHNRSIDGRLVADGCLSLLVAFGILRESSENLVSIDPEFLHFLQAEAQFIDRVIERILSKVKDDRVFHQIFNSEFISHDVIYRQVQIENAAFPLRFSAFKQLLIDFQFLQEHPELTFSKFIINSRYKKAFDKVVLPEIRKRKLGINELRKLLEQQQIYGEEAEKYVLQFERNRLSNRAEDIVWVAEYLASEGYDIASFNSEESTEADRFIEVKSYSGNPYFFWSRNEIEIARIKRARYFLYLVNRDEITKKGYVPLIIGDPYQRVYKAKRIWEQRVEKIRFELLLRDSDEADQIRPLYV